MASDASIAEIRLPVFLWARLVRQLRRRGGGRRESGAFLLSRQHGTSARVSAFICYDDLDPHAYQWGLSGEPDPPRNFFDWLPRGCRIPEEIRRAIMTAMHQLGRIQEFEAKS